MANRALLVLAIASCGRYGFDTAIHVEYTATVADCINPTVPNPDTCLSVNGARFMTVDNFDSGTHNPWVGYMRFDLDDAFGGYTPIAVTLRLHTATAANAVSPGSADITQVAPFVRADLYAAAPTTIAPLAGSVGALVPDQDVEWKLSASLVAPNSSVFLSASTTEDDGTLFWNLAGAIPPVLAVDARH